MSTVLVVADDLIWMSRLAAAVEQAGAVVLRASTRAQADAAVAKAPVLALVDLNGRAYDGVALVGALATTGLPAIAVGQHEDLELRRRALAAGAGRVYSYNRFFREGPTLVSRLLEAEGQVVG
jgi:CheY-like chemotaxis protein